MSTGKNKISNYVIYTVAVPRGDEVETEETEETEGTEETEETEGTQQLLILVVSCYR